MGRHKQPLELAEIKGLVAHNPQRYTKEPVKNAMPLGQPPDHLSKEAKRTWFELEAMVPAGVLTYAERAIMEILSNLLVEYRKDPPAFPSGKYVHLIGMMARLGMTPTDRQKIGVEKSPQADPMDEFM